MEITILAQTQLKDSHVELDLKFCKQYAIGRNLTSEEKDHLYKVYRLEDVYKYDNPIVTLRRRVDNRDGVVTEWEFDYFDIFESEIFASRGFGDSDYWKSENSVHPLHVSAVEWAKKISLQDEYAELEKQVIGGKFSSGALLKSKYNDLYDSELKAKKLYSKAKRGTAPVEVVNEIRDRLMKEYETEKAKIESRMIEIENEIKELNS